MSIWHRCRVEYEKTERVNAVVSNAALWVLECKCVLHCRKGPCISLLHQLLAVLLSNTCKSISKNSKTKSCRKRCGGQGHVQGFWHAWEKKEVWSFLLVGQNNQQFPNKCSAVKMVIFYLDKINALCLLASTTKWWVCNSDATVPIRFTECLYATTAAWCSNSPFHALTSSFSAAQVGGMKRWGGMAAASTCPH